MTYRFTAALAFAVLLAGTAAALADQAIPPLPLDSSIATLQKKERVARHDPLTCPIVFSKVVTSGAWSFVDAGCNAPGEGDLVKAVFHYANGAWNLACTHGREETMSATKAAQKCGMTHAQAVGFGYPDI